MRLRRYAKRCGRHWHSGSVEALLTQATEGWRSGGEEGIATAIAGLGELARMRDPETTHVTAAVREYVQAAAAAQRRAREAAEDADREAAWLAQAKRLRAEVEGAEKQAAHLIAPFEKWFGEIYRDDGAAALATLRSWMPKGTVKSHDAQLLIEPGGLGLLRKDVNPWAVVPKQLADPDVRAGRAYQTVQFLRHADESHRALEELLFRPPVGLVPAEAAELATMAWARVEGELDAAWQAVVRLLALGDQSAEGSSPDLDPFLADDYSNKQRLRKIGARWAGKPLKPKFFEEVLAVLGVATCPPEADIETGRARNAQRAYEIASRQYIVVPRTEEDIARAERLCAAWDAQAGMYYIPGDINGALKAALLRHYDFYSTVKSGREYIEVPIEKAEDAVAFGAKFDAQASAFFVPSTFGVADAFPLRVRYRAKAASECTGPLVTPEMRSADERSRVYAERVGAPVAASPPRVKPVASHDMSRPTVPAAQRLPPIPAPVKDDERELQRAEPPPPPPAVAPAERAAPKPDPGRPPRQRAPIRRSRKGPEL